MRRQRDEAYVLDTRPLGEADLIVTLLSEHHGQVRAVARAARRSRRRFGGSLEPMTRVRATWLQREGRELHRLEQMESVRSHAAMQADPLRQSACAVMAEVIRTFVHEGEPDERSFRLLGAALDSMGAGAAPRLLLRYFEYWMLQLHGLLPRLDACSQCERSLGAGGIRVLPGGEVCCRSCAGGSGRPAQALSRDERELLSRMRLAPPAEIARSANVPTRTLEALLRGTLESFAERRFRTYRHFTAADDAAAGEVGP